MPATILPMPPPVAVDEPTVRVYRLDWHTCRNDVDVELDTAYYAQKHADQIGAQVLRWLAEVPDSFVMVDTEEMPLEEWIGEYDGEAEDAEP